MLGVGLEPKTTWAKVLHPNHFSDAVLASQRIVPFSNDNFVGRKIKKNDHKGARTQGSEHYGLATGLPIYLC